MVNSSTIDQGKIKQILALVVDLNNDELGVLMNKLTEEHYTRHTGEEDPTDTVQL